MSALAADHRNDVVSTVVALIFGIIGKILNQENYLLLIPLVCKSTKTFFIFLF
jgi:hypothetical protein